MPTEVSSKKGKKKQKATAAVDEVEDMAVDKPTAITNGDALQDHKSEKKKKKEKRKLDQKTGVLDMAVDDANGVNVEQNGAAKKKKKKKDQQDNDGEVQEGSIVTKSKKKKSRSEHDE